MPSVCIAITKEHIAEAHIDDVVLSQCFQQLFALYIVSSHREKNKGTAQHRDVLIDRFTSDIFSAALLHIAFMRQDISNVVG